MWAGGAVWAASAGGDPAEPRAVAGDPSAAEGMAVSAVDAPLMYAAQVVRSWPRSVVATARSVSAVCCAVIRAFCALVTAARAAATPPPFPDAVEPDAVELDAVEVDGVERVDVRLAGRAPLVASEIGSIAAGPSE